MSYNLKNNNLPRLAVRCRGLRPQVQPIAGDMGASCPPDTGARKALHEFFDARKIKVKLSYLDDTGRQFIKPA